MSDIKNKLGNLQGKIKVNKERQGFMKHYDMFGHHIGVNFEGGDTHNTALGGCCSIMIKLCIFVYVVMNVKKLVLREDDNIVT